MFRSLRSKLVLSHFLVILTAFVLTAAIASVPIRRVQEARLRNGLILSSESVARQVDLARTLSSDTDLLADTTQIEFAQRIIDAESRRSGNRILIVDAGGTVMMDSDQLDSYSGRSLPAVARTIAQLRLRIGSTPRPARVAARVALVLETYSVSAGTLEGRRLTVAGSGATALPNRTNFYVVAWAPQSSAPLLDDFVRPLALASAIALIASVTIGLLISRSVTGPLQRLTTSLGEIDASALDARIDVESGGEVGTLVTAFNRMLDRLASTYQSQRELLANIAHELRTPLTSIQGYAQALRDDVITNDEARSDALLTISDEARRMTTLVEHIMQLSRLESGQMQVRFERVSLATVLERVERQFAHLSHERGVALSFDHGADLELVGDGELLAQAVSNLTSNAIRHTSAGGTVEVKASRISTPSAAPGFRITVRDTGAGMSAVELERIFERFYRSGERTPQNDGRNFGLGLAIVNEIVNRHRGRISVESAPGLGTTFTIDLPFDPRSAGEGAA